MKKRMTSIFLTLAMVALLLPAMGGTARADTTLEWDHVDIIHHEKFFDSSTVTATISNDGKKLTLSGGSITTNPTNANQITWPWLNDSSYSSNIETVVITGPLTINGSLNDMFLSMEKLTSITGLNYLNTANVTNMSFMFSGCSSVTSLDLSGFNTSNVTNMYGMFSDCSGLTSLNLSNFNTSNVTDMRSMFSGCSGLTSLDLSRFNTSQVTYASSMIPTTLKSLTLPANFCPNASDANFTHDMVNSSNYTEHYSSGDRIPYNTPAASYTACYPIKYYSLESYMSNGQAYKYSANFPSGTTVPGYYVYGQSVALPPAPVREGYSFLRWYNQEKSYISFNNYSYSYNEVAGAISSSDTGEKSYFAKWEAIPYSITYDLNGGSVSTANPTSYTVETTSFTLTNPTRSGYDFAGWTGSNGSTPEPAVTITKGSTGDRTYTANWTEITPWKGLQYAITNGTSLENVVSVSGSTITLLTDITAEAGDSCLTVPSGKNVTIDLNGHIIDRHLTTATANGNVITVNGSLTVTDSGTGGTITGGNNDDNGNNDVEHGGGVYVKSGGTFILEGGSISNNVTSRRGGGVNCMGTFTMSGGSVSNNTAKTWGGGGVYVTGKNHQFNMTGGTISGNLADTGGEAYGGGVGLYDSVKMTMTGGTISGNFCKAGGTKQAWGGGIYVNSTSNLTMSGGSITGNNAGTASDGFGGGVFVNNTFNLSGNPTISGNVVGGSKNGTIYTGGTASNVYLNGKKITVNGTLTGGAGSIGVSMKTPGEFTSSTDTAYNDETKFASNMSSYSVEKDGASNQLKLVANAVNYNISITGTISNGTVTCDKTTATAGETITLTVTPATGYALSTISVTKDGDSNTLLAVSGSGSSYTFTMPAFAVNVTASFALIPATAPTISTQPSNLSLTVGYAAGSVSVAASVANGHTLGYQWYSNTSNSSTGGTIIDGATNASYSIPTGKNAGTYYYYCVVTATRTDNNQTASTTSGVAVVTVGKGAPTYTAPTALTLTYDGGEQALVTAGSTSHGTITYSTSQNGNYTGTIPTGVNAGDYEVWWKLTGDENHNDVGPTKLMPKIDPKEVTVSGITADDKTYDGTTAAALDTSGATLTGKLEADTLTVSAAGTFDSKDVGEGKTVTISGLTLGGASAGNYQLAPSGQQTTATARITAKPITVTAEAKSKTYGESDPTLTYTSSGLVGTDALSGALTRDAGEGVGEYAIGQGSLTAGNNYTITYQGAKLTIAAKTLTVSANPQSKTYGDDDPALTYTVSGLESGDSVTGTLSRAEGENAGAYAIGQGTLSAGDNYAINYTGANLTIDQKEVGLDWTDTELTYNTTPQKPTATATGLVGNDTCAVTVTGEQTDVGSYTATASGLSNGNYKLPSANTASFTIAPKTVNAPAIELSPSSFVYDGSAKEPTVTVKDGGTVIPSTEYSVSYADNTNVGAATATITDNSGGNYIVSGGTTFAITHKSLSLTVDITGWTYGGTANAPSVSGNTGGGAVTYEYKAKGAEDSTYTATVPTAAGEYTVRASVAQADNYAAGTATADFTIAKAALTITAKPHTIVKGDAPANDGVTYSGFVNGENESVLGGALAYAYDTDGSTAGVSFTITPSGLTSGNYAITYVPGTLTVKDTYAVTYHRNYAADDGEIIETQRKVEDTALMLSLPAAARTGYTLDGWFSARSGGTKRTDDTYTGNAALDLYAQWTPNPYTVTFNANGGTGEMDDMAFTYDVAQTLTANAFTRSAYNFVGWARASDGAVAWNDGATVQNLTDEENGTFTLYAVWTPKPVYTVDGKVVTSDHTPIGNVAVKLMRGNEEIASTVTAADGLYVFDAPADTYNIVATWQKDEDTAVTKTQLVVLNANKSYELVMPNGKTNSVLELKGEDTPPVVVGGLDNEAAAVKAEAEGNTTSDTKKVTVTMTVESKDEAEVSTDATAIKTVASGRTLDYLAITVEKDVDNVKTGITETANVLEIVVPYNFSGKQTVEVYRCHGTDAEAMTALDAQPDNEHPAADGTFRLDKDNGLIYIYARNFSTYAIGYTVPAPTYFAPTTYPPSIPDTPHGELAASPTAPKTGDKVTVTPKPDDGFAVDTVTVTGPDGKIVPVTDNGDGTYTFTQPNGKVKIEVTFKAVGGGYADCAGDASCPISAFTDTDPAAWYHDGVHWAIENGVMNGVGDGLFLPNGTTSRAMLAQILYNMDDKPTIRSGIPFEDVSASDWYAMAISWAKSNGIIDGYGNGKFGPNDDLTREQLVTIIYRYAKKKGINVSVGEDTNILSYDDTFDVSEWAISAMQWAVGSGLVSGRTASTLNPQDKTTRAEIATIIMRYCTEVAR